MSYYNEELTLSFVIFSNFGIHMNRFFVVSLSALATLIYAPGHAQSAVSSQLTAQRSEIVQGKAVLVDANVGKPGEFMVYTNTYRNNSKSPADKLLATIPVPAGTSFVAGSARPAAASASLDGTHFAAMPLVRTVRQPDGTKRSETVPPSEYRALQWDVGTLQPGASASVLLQVRVETAEAQPAALLAANPAARQ
jgi:uncharacterized repeat protein (TIGR01451 family)